MGFLGIDILLASSDINVLNTKAHGQEQLIDELKERNQVSVVQLQKLENERNTLMDKSEKLGNSWLEKENNLNSLIQNLQTDLLTKDQRIKSLTESIQTLDKEKHEEQDRFQKEYEALENKMTELSDQTNNAHKDCQQEKTNHKETLTELRNEQKTSKVYIKQIAELQSDNDYLRSQLTTLTSAINELASNKDATKQVSTN